MNVNLKVDSKVSIKTKQILAGTQSRDVCRQKSTGQTNRLPGAGEIIQY